MPLLGWSEEDVYVVAERAYSLYLQGRHGEAAVVLEGVCVLDPGNRYAAHALAAVCLARGQAERALLHLDRWLDGHPADREARARRGEALLALDRIEEARREWEILRRGPSIPEARRFQLRLQAASAAWPAEATGNAGLR